MGTSGRGPDGAVDVVSPSSPDAAEVAGGDVVAEPPDVVGEPASIDVEVVAPVAPVVRDGWDIVPSEPHAPATRLNARADAAATTMVRRAPRNDTRVILAHAGAPDNPFDAGSTVPRRQPESGWWVIPTSKCTRPTVRLGFITWIRCSPSM